VCGGGQALHYAMPGCRIPTGGNWRREPESNRPTRICNPVHNRFAIAPCGNCLLRKIKGKQESFPVKFGAGNEARTRDLNLGKVALYQLSYSRKKRSPHYMDIAEHVKNCDAIFSSLCIFFSLCIMRACARPAMLAAGPLPGW
jgi:hypothetical protein